VIEKIGSQVFLLSSTPLMPGKNDLVLSQNALSTEDFYFYFVPSECGHKISHLRHTVGDKMLYDAKTFCYDIFPKYFEHL
jgi:hypothetical protein